MIQQPKIEVSLSKTMLMYHNMGNIGVEHYLQFRNTGGKTGTINKIIYFVKKKDNDKDNIILIPQAYFLPTSQVATKIPIPEIILNPNEKWENYADIYKLPDKEEETKIAEISQKIITEIKQQKPPYRMGQPIIDYQTYLEIKNYVNQKLSYITIGEYYLLIACWKDEEKAPFFEKAFQFSLYEFDRNKLDQMIDQYQWGLQQNIPPVNIGLTNINDIDIVKNLKTLMLSQMDNT